MYKNVESTFIATFNWLGLNPLTKGYRVPSALKRSDVLEANRNRKMASSAHAYVRANTIKFYKWLESSDAVNLPKGPAIWICGDCHMGNLGPIADAQDNSEPIER